jgi:hypothetical protein
MKLLNHKYFIFTFIFFLSIFLLNFILYPSGFTGVTKKTGGVGCVCHSIQSSANVNVSIIGPDSVATSQTVFYRIKMSGGSAVTGGFDAAAFNGNLDTTILDIQVKKDPANGELTHLSPKQFTSDTVSWIFKYTAPGTNQTDTLYACANSTNNNNQSDTADMWNHALNKPIKIYTPIGIKPSSTTAVSFKLYQNYPNPFNPVTNIKFVQPNVVGKRHAFSVQLIIYNSLAQEVTTLVNEELEPGTYEIRFDGTNYPSGVYFYKLITSQGSLIKTMVLIK